MEIAVALHGLATVMALLDDGKSVEVAATVRCRMGQEEDRRRTREAGFDSHLVKPVDLQALRELLEP